jgi:hypothetical protein
MHLPEKHRSCFAPVFVQLHWQFDAEVYAGADGRQDGRGAGHVITGVAGAGGGEGRLRP